MRALTPSPKKSPAAPLRALGLKAFWIPETMKFLSLFPERFDPDSLTASSTLDWREYWRFNDASWRSIAELQVAILNGLLATSSFWASS